MRFAPVFVALLVAVAVAVARADDDGVDADDADVHEMFEQLEKTYSGAAGGEDQQQQQQQRAFTDPTAVAPYNTKLTYLFPEAPFLNIESGKYTEVLVGVSNDAAQGDLIVRTVEASFRYVQDMTQTIQNFTTYKYDIVVPPNEQATLSYRIPIGPVFQPLQIGLVVLLTFETPDKLYFQLPAFNGTVSLVDPVRTFDFQAIFLFIFGLGFVAAAIYAIYNAFFAKQKGRSTRQSAQVSTAVSSKADSPSTAKAEEAVNLDWIPKQNLSSPSTKPAATRKR